MSQDTQEQTTWSYADKIAQTHKEAKATVVALVVTIVAWVVLGFGLASIDVAVAGMPLWALGGTVGTWIVAVVVVAILNRGFFKDFTLDEDSNDALVEEAAHE